MSAEDEQDEFYIEDDDAGSSDFESSFEFDWDDFYDELEGLDDAEDEDYG